jgi:hypothetical protein
MDILKLKNNNSDIEKTIQSIHKIIDDKKIAHSSIKEKYESFLPLEEDFKEIEYDFLTSEQIIKSYKEKYDVIDKYNIYKESKEISPFLKVKFKGELNSYHGFFS